MEFENISLQEQIKLLFTFIFKSCYEWKKLNETEPDKYQDRNEYVLKKLWDEFGIKRRNIGNDLVLLNYSKSHEKYDKNNKITRLCRHLILDLNSMSIRSLGIPKCDELNIDDLKNNFGDYKVQKLNAGTMIVYNQQLNKEERFYVNSSNGNDENNGEESSNPLNKNVDISTRNKLGTSNYNTSVSFKEYFNYNNYVNGTDVDKLSDEYCYVFNCEHINEHITSNNLNMLIACYKFNSLSSQVEKFQEFMRNYKEGDDIKTYIDNHCKNMVSCMELSSLKEKLKELGVGNIDIPSDLTFNTYDDMMTYMNTGKGGRYFQGFVLYDKNNNRYKIKNESYVKLKELRGDLPLNPNIENRENIFKVYWRLVKNNELQDFVREFDTKNIYVHIFNMFYETLNTFINNVFNYYQKANVKRLIDKSTIPKHLGPLCYELHGKYLENKEIITRKVVNDYIMSQDVGRIYWRVFDPSRHITTI